MDKLDKVSPKDLRPFRDNPIAQGVLSNFIYAGISAAMGWIVAHYALLWGMGPHWAILMGSFVFFLIAVSVNLLRRKTEASVSNTAIDSTPLPDPAKLSSAPEKPKIEIISPFDHDEVGLHEIVRGRISPPNQKLQVAVLAGDNNWYLQEPVIVTGSKWSVNCQFGRRDKPDKGSYKVVALLGNELKGNIPYPELSIDSPKSNVITVHRPEVTIEQDLMTARSERDNFKKQLQSATNEFAGMERQVETLTTDNSKLMQELVRVKKDKHTLEQSLESIRHELSEARATTEAQQASYKLERDDLLNERKLLNEKLLETQRDLKQANLRANQESNQKDQLYKLYHEGERKLGDLRWLEARMKDQGEHLDNWIRIKRVACVKVQLTETPRMIIFALWVHNGSIFDVTFDFEHLAGRLHFKNRQFNDPVRVPPNKITEILHPGGEMEIVIEQPLLATEAETVLTAQKIGDPDGIFWLGNLSIPVSTVNSPQSFNNHKLRIYSEIELQYLCDFPCD